MNRLEPESEIDRALAAPNDQISRRFVASVDTFRFVDLGAGIPHATGP